VRFHDLIPAARVKSTGGHPYEISRACKSLINSRFVEAIPNEKDRRVRLLKPTSYGKKAHDQVIVAAAKRLREGLSLDDGFHGVGENRRLQDAAESYRKRNRTLLGVLQLSFFDTNPG